ncbi:AbrB/MazE/SpoVT family DNA-binding domain-containing protein [Candidatus Woesearchaeota archaeon]|nr:AbrB/MazE/SpoVT family DNA-binding domain-containing protein [Candidatus Woesearchaeota archaeon]
MEISITTMSENGQVVIPAEVRRDAKLKPSTKFIVFNRHGNIVLRVLKKEAFERDVELIEAIDRGEKDIAEGRYVKADTSQSAEEIVDLLLS